MVWTYIDRGQLCYLREVDLIVRLLIAQTILIPIWNPIVYAYSFQFLYIAIVSHFKVDADSAIERRLRIVDVNVRNAGFDDFCEDGFRFFRVLCICYSHLDWMTSIETLSNCRGEGGVM